MPEKEYIAMCDTPKLQEMWKPSLGDRVSTKGRVMGRLYILNECAPKAIKIKDSLWRYVPVELSVIGYVVDVHALNADGHGKERMGVKEKSVVIGEAGIDILLEDCIWLPTQEQLWGMLPEDTNITIELCSQTYWIIYPPGFKGTAIPAAYTLEEVLLQFVMQTKFNKRCPCGNND